MIQIATMLPAKGRCLDHVLHGQTIRWCMPHSAQSVNPEDRRCGELLGIQLAQHSNNSLDGLPSLLCSPETFCRHQILLIIAICCDQSTLLFVEDIFDDLLFLLLSKSCKLGLCLCFCLWLRRCVVGVELLSATGHRRICLPHLHMACLGNHFCWLWGNRNLDNAFRLNRLSTWRSR